MEHERLPEVLFDVTSPSPTQQKIVDVVTRALVGGLILMEVGEELLREYRKYRNATTKRASASISQ